jgi:hypothetical protein
MSKIKWILSIFVMVFGLVNISNYIKVVAQTPPEPQRDDAVKKFLIPSLCIYNNGIIGSGTICYYDAKNNVAYVLSCAHLFYAENNNVIVEAFYHNDKKLTTPKKYVGEIVAIKIDGYEDDIAVVKFTPDWKPVYFPISKITYRYRYNSVLNSVGCDTNSEVANYYVKVYNLKTSFLITYENSPRPGRSGGGLITNDGFIVGICARTDAVDGTGRGYYVHIVTIHKFCMDNELEFLLNNNKNQEIPLRKFFLCSFVMWWIL